MRFYKVQTILAPLTLLKFWGRRKVARYIGRRPFEKGASGPTLRPPTRQHRWIPPAGFSTILRVEKLVINFTRGHCAQLAQRRAEKKIAC